MVYFSIYKKTSLFFEAKLLIEVRDLHLLAGLHFGWGAKQSSASQSPELEEEF